MPDGDDTTTEESLSLESENVFTSEESSEFDANMRISRRISSVLSKSFVNAERFISFPFCSSNVASVASRNLRTI